MVQNTMTQAAELLDTKAIRLIGYHASRLVNKSDTTFTDQADLESELLLHVLTQLPQYNPRRGAFSTFLSRTLRHKAVDVLRHEQRVRRIAPPVVSSLGHPIECADGEHRSIEKLLCHDAVRLQNGLTHRSVEETVIPRIDVERALSHLSPADQQICQALMRYSVAEVAAVLGVTYATLSQRCARIGHKLIRAGLASHFPTKRLHSSTSRLRGAARVAIRRTQYITGDRRCS